MKRLALLGIGCYLLAVLLFSAGIFVPGVPGLSTLSTK